MSMTQDPTELFSAGDGNIFISQEGVDFPTDVDEVLDAGWLDFGLTTDAGPRFSFDRTTKDIPAWPLFDPARTLVTAIPKQIDFDLLQWSGENFQLGLGGGTITPTANGAIYEPPEPSFQDIRQMIIVGVDGDRTYKWCFRRVRNVKALTFPFVQTDVSPLTIGMKVLAATAPDKPFFILTDDPAFVELGS